MSSGMVSRWPIVVSLRVAASDCEVNGALTRTAVERLFSQARASYFELCTTVDTSTLQVRATTVQPGQAAAGDRVTVSVNVTEVFPDSFTMTARIRPVKTDGIAATAWCPLSP